MGNFSGIPLSKVPCSPKKRGGLFFHFPQKCCCPVISHPSLRPQGGQIAHSTSFSTAACMVPIVHSPLHIVLGGWCDVIVKRPQAQWNVMKEVLSAYCIHYTQQTCTNGEQPLLEGDGGGGTGSQISISGGWGLRICRIPAPGSVGLKGASPP